MVRRWILIKLSMMVVIGFCIWQLGLNYQVKVFYEAGNYNQADKLKEWIIVDLQPQLTEKIEVLAHADRRLKVTEHYYRQFKEQYDLTQASYTLAIGYGSNAVISCIAYRLESHSKGCEQELQVMQRKATKILNGLGIGKGAGNRVSDLLYQRLGDNPQWFYPLMNQGEHQVKQLIVEADQYFYPEEWQVFMAHQKARQSLIIPDQKTAI